MSPEQKKEAEQVRRIFTALLVLGVSGAGKTSLLATFADYLWETYQKILLLYSWDGGAITTDIQVRMYKGIIRFWRARTRSAPGLALETMALATKGYWPKSIDPRTGETLPAVDLVPPITTRYTMFCGQGHELKTVPSPSLILPTFCETCKKMADSASGLKAVETVARTKGFELVGGVAFDGLTSMTQVVMDDMDRMRGHGHIGGEKSSFGGVITSGSQKFGGNNRADVGFAQTRAQQYVANSLSIPYLMESPVFTGLSTEGSDKGGLTIVGLDLPGQAALTQAPQWFGNIVEADSLIDENGKKHFALRVKPYTDKDGRRHLLKTSASSTGPLPEIFIDPPEDAKRPFTEFNLGKFFRLLDEDLQIALGLSPTTAAAVAVAEYGEAAAIEGSKAVSAPSPTPAAAAIPAAAPAVAGSSAPAPKPTAAPSPAAPRPIARPVAAAAAKPNGPAAQTAQAAPQTTQAVAPAQPSAPTPVAPPAAVTPAIAPAPAATRKVSPPPPGRPRPPQKIETT